MFKKLFIKLFGIKQSKKALVSCKVRKAYMKETLEYLATLKEEAKQVA